MLIKKKEEGHIIFEGLTIKDSFTKKGVGLQMRAHVCPFAPLKKGITAPPQCITETRWRDQREQLGGRAKRKSESQFADERSGI